MQGNRIIYKKNYAVNAFEQWSMFACIDICTKTDKNGKCTIADDKLETNNLHCIAIGGQVLGRFLVSFTKNNIIFSFWNIDYVDYTRVYTLKATN